MSKERLSDAEWKVMQIVWRRPPVTARDVADALADRTGWAYTTVKTLLTRLAGKGFVTERMAGNAALYEPAVAEDEARRSALRGLVDRAFGGDLVPMVRFLLDDDELSPRERNRLREMLAAREKGRRA